MAGTELATAYVTLTIDGSRIGNEVRERLGVVPVEAAKAGKKGGGLFASAFTKPMAGLFAVAGIGALVKQSVGLEAAFSKTMNVLQASSGASKNEIEALREQAMKLGADTSFSANEAADAMLELSKAGISAKDIMSGAAEGTLLLATAGGTDLASAATIASNAMNTFNLEGKDMGTIAAALAGGANASSASVSSLGEALGQVGPGAVNAGLSLQDTVGVLSAFDAAGIKGSDAGTSLKTMLSRLVPQTDKAKSAMKDLGLNFVNADGSFKSITDVAGQLQAKLGPLSEAQRTTALNTLFGADASRAASVLMKEGTDGIGGYIKATKDKDAAEKMAKASMSGTAGALEQLSGGFETMKLAIGQALAPAVTMLANTLSQHVLPALTAVFSYLGEHEGLTRSLTVAVLALVAAYAAYRTITGIIAAVRAVQLGFTAATYGAAGATYAAGAAAKVYGAVMKGQVIAAFVRSTALTIRDTAARVANTAATVAATIAQKTIAAASKAWAAAQWILNAALTANPIGLVIAGIALLVGAFILAYKKSETFRAIIDASFAVLKDIGSKVLPVFKAVVVAIFNGIKTYFTTVFRIYRALFSGAWSGIKAITQAAFTVIRVLIINPIKAAQAGVRAAISAISSGMSRTWNSIKSVTKSAFNNVKSLVTGPMTAIVDYVRGIPGRIAGLAGKFAGAGRSIIGAFVDGLKNAGGVISGIAGNVWDAVRTLLNGGIDRINAALEFSIKLPGKNISVNPPNIPHLATGARATGATLAVIGEGAEAETVFPDSKLAGFLARMTQAATANIGGAALPGSVRLVVDGHEFTAYLEAVADERVGAAGALSDEAWRAGAFA